MKKFIVLFLIVLGIISTGCVHNNPLPSPITTISPSGSVGNLTVTFIDVGQGDSEMITSPSGKIMLIDAGEPYEVSKVESVLGNTKTIDYVVATHSDTDHIGGMKSIVDKYTISEFIYNGYTNVDTATYKNLVGDINSKHISYVNVKNGDTINFDPNVNVNVVNPPAKLFNTVNDNSVVLNMIYGNVSFLFTGDAGLNAETLYAKKLNHVNILKVGHHGSVSATGPYLLSKIHPDISIISVGKDNTYGHPDASTLKKLINDGSTIYRTDLNGSITITTDGNTYSIITER